MCSQGGEAVWGNSTFAPDDLENQEQTHGHFLSFRPKENETVPHIMKNPGAGNLTVDGASDWILSHTPTSYQVSVSVDTL